LRIVETDKPALHPNPDSGVKKECTFETGELEPEPRKIEQFTLTPDERIERAFFKLMDRLKKREN